MTKGKVNSGKICVIGAGVMGKALLSALIETHWAPKSEFWFATKSEESAERTSKELGISAPSEWKTELKKTKIVFLCVKPAQIEEVAQKLKREGLPNEALVISVAAGVNTKQLEKALGGKNPVVRAMPNTPCAVRAGFTAICGGSHTAESDLELARSAFSALGLCLEVEERLFDAVTGLSGSGPAYFLLMLEAIVDGGVRVGLPRQMALQMATQTMLGTATLVKELGRHPASLRDDVTTPAGCTIGGLLVMEDGRIRSIIARAIEEATKIASKLGEK